MYVYIIVWLRVQYNYIGLIVRVYIYYYCTSNHAYYTKLFETIIMLPLRACNYWTGCDKLLHSTITYYFYSCACMHACSVKLTRGELPCIGKTCPVINLNLLIDKFVCSRATFIHPAGVV